MTITKSIGSAGGRDYSTIQAWEDARPATLTDAEVGECYNDSEFSGATVRLTVAGITTSATNTLTLKAAAGQSFRDNASVQSNALRYNASNGVGIRVTASYNDIITNTTVQYFYLEGLQLKNSTASQGQMDLHYANGKMKNCIVECYMRNNANAFGVRFLGTWEITNNLFIDYGVGAGRFLLSDGGGAMIYVNNTIVRVSGTPSTSIATRDAYGTNSTMKNCAVFGFATFTSRDAAWSTGLNNASDLSIGFGSSNQASKTYSSQFENITSGTHDYRAKSGGDLINNGVTDSTYGATDIAGTSRPSGAAYDIGCWELVSAASFIARQGLNIIQAVNRASTF